MSVFISYSRADSAFVDRLGLRLTNQDIKVWKDRWKTAAGESFVRKIYAAIEDAAFFCVVLSPSAVESTWVKRELEAALSRESRDEGLRILPLLIEDCELPASLAERLYVDFRADFEAGLERLLGVIEAHYDPGAVGRVAGDGSYFSDWAIEEGVVDGRFFMQVDVVSFDLEEEWCVLTQFEVSGNEHATAQGLGLKAGESMRELLLRTCAEEFAQSPARIKLRSNDVRRAHFTITGGDERVRFDVRMRARRLGRKSVHAMVFNVGALFGQIASAPARIG